MRRKKLYVKLLGTMVITGLSCTNLSVVSAETMDSKEDNRAVTSQSLSKFEKKKELVLTPEVTDTDITAVIGEEGQLTMDAPDLGKEIELEDITTITVKDSEILSIDAAGKWKALKAGETQVEVAFVFIDEDMEKLKELYPDPKASTGSGCKNHGKGT